MIDVHLYGKLRRFCAERAANANSVLHLSHEEGATVGSIADRIGIPREELGSNLFVNACYATLETPVPEGSRVGLFPDDMQLLYKWYFDPKAGKT